VKGWEVACMDDRIKEAWNALQASQRLKRRTKAQIRKKTFDYGRDLPRLRARRRRLAGCLAAVALCLGGTGLWFLPVSTIGLDINPSLELQVNVLDRVTTLRGCNADGILLAEQLEVAGLPYDEAMQRILLCDQLQPHLQAGQPVSITVVGGSADHSEEMLSRVVCRAYAIVEEDHVFYCQTDRATVRAAREAGLTVVQYRAWQILLEQDAHITPEEIRKMKPETLEGIVGLERLDNPCGE